MTTFKEYLINEAKLLGHNPEFVFANKQVFDADFTVDPTSPEAQKIISRFQRPKIEELASKLDVQWTILFAKQLQQHSGYGGRGHTRSVWTYILVGNDRQGNEIAYYKYDSTSPGAGQSHVYANRRNKTKLSWLLGATPEKARAELGLITVTESGGPVPTDEKDLVKLLKRKFRKAVIKRDDKNQIRLVLPVKPYRKSDAKRALSISFKPYRKKIIVKYQLLYGAKEVRKGYGAGWSGPTKIGTFATVNELIERIRSERKRW